MKKHIEFTKEILSIVCCAIQILDVPHGIGMNELPALICVGIGFLEFIYIFIRKTCKKRIKGRIKKCPEFVVLTGKGKRWDSGHWL